MGKSNPSGIINVTAVTNNIGSYRINLSSKFKQEYKDNEICICAKSSNTIILSRPILDSKKIYSIKSSKTIYFTSYTTPESLAGSYKLNKLDEDKWELIKCNSNEKYKEDSD